ncbi:insertion element protein [Fredinandcohnia sp. FSL W7-1320]|uniref:insertion element protein n=1 Tax=Fredinandcohnia sp. FSL W7-1320 TaxID=2954540 RepID=UPI0030FDE292
MAKLKRLTNKNDGIIEVMVPVSEEERLKREMDYPSIPDNRFATKFRNALFEPVVVKYKDREYKIQMNSCINPYCKNYGLPQKQYDVKGKPKRYKSVQAKLGTQSRLVCNPDPVKPAFGAVLGCGTNSMSNWSIAEEIKRLAMVNSVLPIEPEYQFHKEGCDNQDLTPFTQKEAFRRCGKSSSNCQKYQCKCCKKITNVLPSTKESTTYHQQRNDVLPLFAELITNRTPVNRVIEILDIGAQTYYHKLEWLYRRCLEFQERHETKLKDKEFNELWINTDKMIYYLNNVRKKNAGSKYLIEQEEKQFPTQVVISSDLLTRYVFRSDIAYDWDITLEEISEQTKMYKDDHLHTFAQRYGHLRYSYAPQPPTEFDTQTKTEYEMKRSEFFGRSNYIDGLHTNSTYTNIAHFWHLKQMLNAKEWRFSTDHDSTIISALMRVFLKEIDLGDAHHFIYKIDKSKSLRESMEDYKDSRAVIRNWALNSNIDDKNITRLARLMLAEELMRHKFYSEEEKEGRSIRKWAQNPIVHPLPFKDTGYATVDCTTDVSSYEPKDLARMIQKVNNKSTDTFINQIRRRISILERPLVTSRGDGKSYIYSNFNPKYAQYAITILRTYYNFCMPYKAFGELATPAQRIGITDKIFDWKDIIYFR